METVVRLSDSVIVNVCSTKTGIIQSNIVVTRLGAATGEAKSIMGHNLIVHVIIGQRPCLRAQINGPIVSY